MVVISMANERLTYGNRMTVFSTHTFDIYLAFKLILICETLYKHAKYAGNKTENALSESLMNVKLVHKI